MIASTCTGGGGGTVTPSPLPRVTGSPPARVRAAPVRFLPARFHLPLPIQREVAALWKGRIYVAGGLDGAGSSVGDVLSIDPATGRVVQLGRMPQPFHDGAAAIIGHTLFTFGGG